MLKVIIPQFSIFENDYLYHENLVLFDSRRKDVAFLWAEYWDEAVWIDFFFLSILFWFKYGYVVLWIMI
jgi:hypothetical protein